MVWTEARPLTVGQIRAVMEGLPDDAQAFVEAHPWVHVFATDVEGF